MPPSFAPVNACIYCNVTEPPLTKEHIIPLSLNGKLVLRAASCPLHAKLTSALEMDVARRAYGNHRALEGTSTRHKEEREKLLSSKVEINGIDRSGLPVSTKIDMKDFPRLPLQVVMLPPKVLRHGSNSDLLGITLKVEAEDGRFDALFKELGWRTIEAESPPLIADSFIRVLAKIAHSYTVAIFGNNGFERVLLPTILGETEDITQFVGGFEPQQEQAEEPLVLREEPFGDRTALVVEISLTFYRKLPRYQVVSGFRI